MIRAIALDDDVLSLDLLKECCATQQIINLTKTFLDTTEAAKYLEGHALDLIFLDVDMPSIMGLDFYRRYCKNLLVVFTTAHSRYAAESYELDAVDYLIKPYTLSRFLHAAQKVEAQFRLKTGMGNIPEPAIHLRSDSRIIKILLKDIHYIQSMKDYIKVFCNDGKVVISRMTMKALDEILPEERFVRVHRSYIVAKDMLREIRSKSIILNDIQIPIGELYERSVMETFLRK